MDKEEVKQKIQQAMQGKQGDLLDILLSIPSPYFAFDGRPIAKDYPKAFKVLKQYLIKNSNGEISDLSDDDAVMAMFVNPRMLYDFFDSKGIHGMIVTGGSVVKNDGTESPIWGYMFNDEDQVYTPLMDTRHEAEKQLFTEAFSKIEKGDEK